jgi:hypothetical protein
MKKSVFVILLGLNLSIVSFPAISQVTQLKAIHSNSVKYLLKNMNDPGSYKPVSWGAIEKMYTEFDSTRYCAGYDKQIDELVSNSNRLHDFRFNMELKSHSSDFANDSLYLKAEGFMKRNSVIIDSLKQERRIASEKGKLSFKPVVDRYRIEHTFRARNGYNGLILATYVFLIDKKYRVINMQDKKEEEMELQDLLNSQADLKNKIQDLKNKYSH